MEIETGKYAVGTKLWMTDRNGVYRRVTVKDNRISLGKMYHGYTVEACSDSRDEYYIIGAVSESSLTYRRAQ
jgi:hypothetical protein